MSLRRIASIVALATGAATPLVAAVAYSPCADFISSRVGDSPVSGVLIGYMQSTYSIVTPTYHWSETSYYGYYDIGYAVITVDCATYSRVA